MNAHTESLNQIQIERDRYKAALEEAKEFLESAYDADAYEAICIALGFDPTEVK